MCDLTSRSPLPPQPPSSENKSIKSFFSEEVSSTYGIVNHILTFGNDILWRGQAARIAAAYGGTEWADMCTGNGETPICLSRLAPKGIAIHAVDFSTAMMAEARKKE